MIVNFHSFPILCIIMLALKLESFTKIPGRVKIEIFIKNQETHTGLNLFGLLTKSGTVLESWEHTDFRNVPDFDIWPRDPGECL